MSERTPGAAHRDSLARKVQVVCDHATAVAKGYKTGFYLHGTGGGKSHTVLGQFERLGVSAQLHNSRMTGLGLFLTLKGAPDATHVLEDMERVTKDPDAQGVLRSALWAQPGHDRTVTWTTAKSGRPSFPFRGGLVPIGNRPLADLPELRALATRIEVYHMAVSDAELTVLMRDIAAAGLRVRDRLVLAPDECERVTEHLLKECRAAGLAARPTAPAEGVPDVPPARGRLLGAALGGPGRRQRPRDDLPVPPRGGHGHARGAHGPPPERGPRVDGCGPRRQEAGAGVPGEDRPLPRRLLPPQGRSRERGVRRVRHEVTIKPWADSRRPLTKARKNGDDPRSGAVSS